MIKSYIQILQDSLVKKLELLTKIEEKSLEQSNMIKSRTEAGFRRRSGEQNGKRAGQ